MSTAGTSSDRRPVDSKSLYDLLAPYAPSDHALQVIPRHVVQRMVQAGASFNRILDLGCGTGESLDFFRPLQPDLEWVGLDIETSPEVMARVRTDGQFCSFDGVHIPFPDHSFDLVYSNQVFEHVRHPERLLAEVRRVLKPSGYFIGSVSYLEPYHSYSYWNYTPYGFGVLLTDAELAVRELRPGVDAGTMILRRALGCPRFFDRWLVGQSPLNRLIDLVGFLTRRRAAARNIIKLLFCAQFCFVAQATRADALAGSPGAREN